MKKTLSMITLAVLTVGLLGSCAKINERLDDLEKKVDGLENEKIASIESQITGINSSIADLGTIRSNIQSLTDEAKSQGQDITDLQAADKSLGKRIEELSKYVGDTLKAYATEEWARATFSTLGQYEKTCDTIAKIDARIGALDENLSKKIADCADSLTTWINKQFEGYYTAAQMDAKTDAMQAEIDSARAANLITDAKADSLAVELTKVQPAIDSAKAQLTREYTAAIDTAITTLDGKLTKQIQDEIEKVNEAVAALAQRVGILEFQVRDLLGRVGALEGMIQSVTILPAYSDGSVKVEDDTLFIECLVNPAKAVWGLTMKNFTVYLHEVATKAVNYREIKINDRKCFSSNPFSGTVSIKVPVKEYMPENPADSSLVVALNVKYRHSGNLTSDYTTEFVPVALPVIVSIDKQSIVVPSPKANKDTILIATVKHSTKGVSWVSSNESIATVVNGTVTIKAGAIGKDTIVVKTIEGNATDTCFVFVGCVEIGGLTWAMCNVGATTVAGTLETCAGYYFSWGNTVGYVHKISKWVMGSDGTTPLGSNGKFDEPNYLSTPGNTLTTDISPAGGYDAARANLGDGWRMPTAAEFKALADACGGSSSYDTSKKPGKDTEVTKGIYWCDNYDGVKGHLFCDGTNKLFFPAAGRGDGTSLSDANANGGYWSSTFDSRNTNCAYYSYFTSGKVHPRSSYPRSFGFPVRPVSD